MHTATPSAKQPARHFRPLSSRQRAELLQRIDATELEALGTVQGFPVSEGTASALRLGSKKAPLTDDRFLLRPDALPTRRVQPMQAAHVCTHDCTQGRACTCCNPKAARALPIPSNPEPIETVAVGLPATKSLRSLFGWLATAAVFGLLAVAMVVMGRPQDH